MQCTYANSRQTGGIRATRYLGLAVVFACACTFGGQLFGQEAESPNRSIESIEKLRKIEAKVLELVPRLLPSVVCIQAGGGSGSGVIVSEDGLVLTAAHVIDKKKELTVVYPDGRKFKGIALGTYGPADAGMVQILEGAPHPFVSVSDGKDIAENDLILAMGHPSGFDIQRGPPLRIGHIQGVEENYIESDTALIGGDSGGPSFDLEGRVIGIHSHISGSVHVNRDGHIRQFREHWESMAKGEHHPIHFSQSVGAGRGDPNKAPWVLGVKLMDTDDVRGVWVEDVATHSPAEKAGLLVGDRIVRINSKEIGSAEEFLEQLSDGQFGEQINLDIERADETRTLSVNLVRSDELEREQQSDGAEKPKAKPAGGNKPPDKSKRSPFRPGDAGESTPSRARSTKLQELAAKAKEGGGKIRLSREELKELRDQLSQKTEKLATATGTRIPNGGSGDWYDAYRSIASPWKDRIVKVIASGKNVGLATRVHDDGWYLCKASDTKNRELQIQLPTGELCAAQQIRVDDGLDIALIRSESKNATSATSGSNPKETQYGIFEGSDSLPMIGTLCLAVGTTDKPAGFGTVSVRERPLDGKTGVILGVQVGVHENGVRIQSVQPRTPASKAGVKVDDLLHAIDGQPIRSEEDLQKIVQSHLDGDVVRLDLERGESRWTLPVKLADSTETAPMPGAREQAMDSITATLSRRRWGFRRGIQHDSAILAKDVGGPLVNLDGKMIGLNIARAGRIQSYAIPTHDIVDFLHEVEAFPKLGLPERSESAKRLSEQKAAPKPAEITDQGSASRTEDMP